MSRQRKPPDAGYFYEPSHRTLTVIGGLSKGIRIRSGHVIDDQQEERLAYIGMCIELERFFADILRLTDADYRDIQKLHQQAWEEQARTRWVNANWDSVRPRAAGPQTLGQLWSEIKKYPEIKQDFGEAMKVRMDAVIRNRNLLAHEGRFDEPQSVADLYQLLKLLIIAFEPSLRQAADIA
jgi:hypothetical protein